MLDPSACSQMARSTLKLTSSNGSGSSSAAKSGRPEAAAFTAGAVTTQRAGALRRAGELRPTRRAV